MTTFDGTGAACSEAPATTSLGAAIAAYAESQIGVPYQYVGGTDTGPSAGDDSNGSG